MRLPHLRCHCTVHPHRPASTNTGNTRPPQQVEDDNGKHCDQCYCYVCDILAKDCTKWSVHCDATDKATRWREKRERRRQASRLPPGIVVDATIGRGIELKQMVDCFRHFLRKDVVLDCDEEGIAIEGTDGGKHRTVVQMTLRTELFREFSCKSPMRVGCTTKDVWKAVQMAKQSTGPVRLVVNKERRLVTVSGEDIPSTDVGIDDNILHKHDTPCVPQHPSPFKARIDLPTAVLKEVIDGFRKRGSKGDVVVECTVPAGAFPNPVGTPTAFFSQVDNPADRLGYHHGQSVRCRDVAVSIEEGDVAVRLKLQTLRDVVRVPSPMAPRVFISLGTDMPALFEYRLDSNCWRRGENGTVKYHCPSASVPV